MKPKSNKAKTAAPNDTVKTGTFRDYVDFIKADRKILYIFLAFHIAFAILLQYCYPYPDLKTDTGGYINWIFQGFLHGGPRPLGYSYFIDYVNSIASGTGAIFLAQYLIYCLAIFFFYTSTVYLFHISNTKLKYTYLVLTLLFIPGLYTTNLLMSDNLFTSLTLILITFCLWLVHRPLVVLLVPIVILLLWIISIRYLGLAYPAFIIPVIFLAFRKKIVPIVSSLLIVVILYGYIQKIKRGTEEDQGVEIFSAFGGWQHANNALHVIPHIDLSEPAISSTDQDMLFIDSIVRYSYSINAHLYPDEYSTSYAFIWLDSLPLRMAFNYMMPRLNKGSYYGNWNEMGLKLQEYGSLLIKEHFPEYFRYYLVNNTLRTAHPPVEIFESFDNPKAAVINQWFNLSDDLDTMPRYDFLRPVLRNLSPVYTFYWILFLVSSGYFGVMVWRKRIGTGSTLFKLILTLWVFVVMYTAASIYGASVNLRFLLPLRPAIVVLAIVAIGEIIQQKAIKEKNGEIHTS